MILDFKLTTNNCVIHLMECLIPALTSCGEEKEMYSLQITDPKIIVDNYPDGYIAVTVEYQFPNPFDAYSYLLDNYKEEEIV